MKKFLFLILLFILIPVTVNAESCNNNELLIKSISLEEKNEGVQEIDLKSTDKNIKLDLIMSEVNDYVNYKIIINNNSKEEYELDNNLFNINSEYIDYDIITSDNTSKIKPKSDKIVYLKVKYKNIVPNDKFDNGLFTDNKLLNINLSTGKDNIINPETGVRISVFIFLLISFITGISMMIKNKKYDKVAILIMLSIFFIPKYVEAICKTSFSIDTNIQIMNDSYIEKPYYNVNLRKYYDHLDYAVDEASSNQEIILMTDVSEDIQATIPANITNLTIDLKGHSIEYYGISPEEKPIINDGEIILKNTTTVENVGAINIPREIINNGKVIIKDELTIFSDSHVFENTGTIEIEKGNLTGFEGNGINNNGTLIMTEGRIDGQNIAINNYGTCNISGGTVQSGWESIYNYENAVSNIKDTRVLCSETCIYNKGELNVNGGVIKGEYPRLITGIDNYGIANLTDVNITAKATSQTQSYGIKNNSGAINIQSGVINSISKNESIGIHNSSELYINDITIYSSIDDHSSNQLRSTGIITTDNSKTVIKDGEINSTYLAMNIKNNSELTLGNNEDEVSTEKPVIQGSDRYGTGIKIDSSSTLNFYDGLIKAKSGLDNCITGTDYTLNLPPNYSIFKETIDGLPTAYLKAN